MTDERDAPPDLATRCRLAFLQGAAEAWREANGEVPQSDVLARILARYPGDPADVAVGRRAATGGDA